MATPIPFGMCIWCRKRYRGVDFKESHILPKCVDLRGEALPAGIVCKSCNHYFVTEIEPVLVADPQFHAVAVLLDPDKMKELHDRLLETESPTVFDEPPWMDRVQLNATIKDQAIVANISYTVTDRLDKEYKPSELGILSRAVHKIAFEYLMWQICNGYEDGEDQLDFFSDVFNPVRAWSRWGQPHGSVRPVLRELNMGHPYSCFVAPVWRSKAQLGVHLNLFRDCYTVSLTSPSETVTQDLLRWVGEKSEDTWVIGEKITSLKLQRQLPLEKV